MGKKIFFAGIVALLAGIICASFEWGGVIGAFLVIGAGIACAVGMLIGVAKMAGKLFIRLRDWFYQKWADWELRRMEPKEQKPRRSIKIPGWAKVVIAMVVSAALALLTGEGNFLVLSGLVLIVAMLRMLVLRVREQFGDALSLVHDMDMGWGIAEVKILGGSTEYQRGGLGGALIGGLLGGSIGAAVGAVTRNGKAIQKQRFAVKYLNGRTGIEEHRVGSRRYNELMQYVRWEDI